MTRVRMLFVSISAGFAMIVSGLVYTQVIKGEYYRNRSERNRIVVIPLEAPRGRIIDRNGKVCVDNRISFDVSVVYKDAGDFKRLASFLSDTLGINRKKLLSAMEEAKKRPYAPTLLVEDIGKTNAIILEQRRIDYPGLIVSTRPKRDYMYSAAASGITGYIGMISRDELERFRTYGYTVTDLIGRSGIERQYDSYLRGVQGGMQVETDSLGRHRRILHVKEGEKGRSVTMTVDMDLQAFCDEIMGERNGSIIAMNPRTGEIYALVSRPGFDPNLFVRKDSVKQIKDILGNRSGGFPLMNRAIACSYPPGSVFKVVTATAALEKGKLDTRDHLSCDGSYRLGKSVFRCWKEEGHGSQEITEAIKNSCNVFFYQTGILVGADAISEYAGIYGYGKETGIDLPGETGGLVPTPAWKRAKLKEPWYAGDTVVYAIGQGYLLATPIQVVRMMAAVANGGYLVTPYVVNKIDDISIGEPRREFTGIADKSLDVIREGLKRVVNDPHGTGMKAKIEGLTVAGKTGTAENPRGKAHGWFSGFAPAEDPALCVVVFVEYGGKGGLEASMLAKQVIVKSRDLGLL
ncbi:MAG: penicillin-binding protein 2 [Candidatus Omnitrophota bacterium]